MADTCDGVYDGGCEGNWLMHVMVQVMMHVMVIG